MSGTIGEIENFVIDKINSNAFGTHNSINVDIPFGGQTAKGTLERQDLIGNDGKFDTYTLKYNVGDWNSTTNPGFADPTWNGLSQLITFTDQDQKQNLDFESIHIQNTKIPKQLPPADLFINRDATGTNFKTSITEDPFTFGWKEITGNSTSSIFSESDWFGYHQVSSIPTAGINIEDIDIFNKSTGDIIKDIEAQVR